MKNILYFIAIVTLIAILVHFKFVHTADKLEFGNILRTSLLIVFGCLYIFALSILSKEYLLTANGVNRLDMSIVVVYTACGSFFLNSQLAIIQYPFLSIFVLVLVLLLNLFFAYLGHRCGIFIASRYR